MKLLKDDTEKETFLVMAGGWLGSSTFSFHTKISNMHSLNDEATLLLRSGLVN